MTLRAGVLRSRMLLLALLAVPGTVVAQSAGAITGTVRAANGGPRLEGARVTLVGTALAVTTSPTGEFAFRGLTPGKYVIQASAIGFATLSSPIEVKALETLLIHFETEPQSVRLPQLDVSERPNLPSEFLRRSQEGGGRYMSRATIERRNASNVAELLRTFPGVRVNCRRYPCSVDFTRSSRSCPPAFILDGMPVDAAGVMTQPPRDLDGIEVYSGLAETPPELRQWSTCGAFVLWTRTPPPRIMKEKTPKPAPRDSAPPPASKPDVKRA
ncbi:MAG TPA: TonB-dependent receptor [Gemmatimonadales bacterium]|jgi:outer membrane receptor for ferrienterochelin and colicins|nr:TonB-dependent receptor [Gemmatimonadales bacterium]